MADPTLVEVTLRMAPSALATLLGLVREQVAVSRDLTDQTLHDGDPDAAAVFMNERCAWQELERPLVVAVAAIRDRFAVSGTIDTKGGK